MTILINALRAHARNFDHKTYPENVYLDLIEKIREATNGVTLGSALYLLLAWKLGKVKLDPSGPYQIGTQGQRYLVRPVSSKALNERHQVMFSSEAFFEWASPVRAMQHFDLTAFHELMERFQPWERTVLAFFVMHCLQPRVFPIIDRWVLLAQYQLEGNAGNRPRFWLSPTALTYERYQRFWLDVLAEAGLGPMSAQINQLKEIDAGLWHYGKSTEEQILAMSNEKVMEASDEVPSFGSSAQSGDLTTSSLEFKQRAIMLHRSGRTQGQAIIEAARELDITLKPSYLEHPGSHFDRWRKQHLV